MPLTQQQQLQQSDPHEQSAASSPFGRRHFPRDSGCYDGGSLSGGASSTAGGSQSTTGGSTASATSVGTVGGNHLLGSGSAIGAAPFKHTMRDMSLDASQMAANSLDDVVAQCSNEILKRVESARRSGKMEDASIGIGGTSIASRGAAEMSSASGVMPKGSGGGVQRIAKKGLLGGSNTSGEDTLSRGAMSEKSSDSGVSSSSLSSGPMKSGGS